MAQWSRQEEIPSTGRSIAWEEEDLPDPEPIDMPDEYDLVDVLRLAEARS